MTTPKLSRIALASGIGVTISGCVEVQPYCKDAAYGSTVNATCPATCGSCRVASRSRSQAAKVLMDRSPTGSRDADDQQSLDRSLAAKGPDPTPSRRRGRRRGRRGTRRRGRRRTRRRGRRRTRRRGRRRTRRRGRRRGRRRSRRR
ncbi:unnamed protein product, partial [Prorocentrum cordatum]